MNYPLPPRKRPTNTRVRRKRRTRSNDLLWARRRDFMLLLAGIAIYTAAVLWAAKLLLG